VATSTNYVKIGAFVILGLGAAAAIAIAIGVQHIHRQTLAYYTYFGESVQGLEIAAPVKLRGVRIGQVGDITLAPDHTMVEVRSDLDVATLKRLGLLGQEPPPDLRAQLASEGLVTGTRFVSVDHFEPQTNPPPVLTFPPAGRYLPATRSIQSTLEDAAAKAADGIAKLVDSLARQGFSDKAVGAAGNAEELLGRLNEMVKGLDGQRIPQRAAATLEDVRTAVDKASHAIDRVGGDTGLIATTQRSLSSIGDVGRNATGATRELDETLAQIRGAAEAIRVLADELEQDPEMLVKGRPTTARNKRSSP
jgi:ABC-type transporter Mla subunit MlaD